LGTLSNAADPALSVAVMRVVTVTPLAQMLLTELWQHSSIGQQKFPNFHQWEEHTRTENRRKPYISWN